MKKIIVMAFGLALYSFASAQDMPGMKMPMQKKENKKTAEKVIYTCVMHPEVQMSKPGNCPKCGMKLIPKKIKITSAKPVPQKHDMQMQKDTSAKKEDAKMDMKMDMPMDDKMKMDENEEGKNNEIEKPKVILQKGENSSVSFICYRYNSKLYRQIQTCLCHQWFNTCTNISFHRRRYSRNLFAQYA